MGFFAGVRCDKCGKERFYSHVGKTHIAQWIREDGWSVSGNKTLCPNCRLKKRNLL